MTRGYSSEEILAMQKDAIRRVNEMRRISEEKLRQSGAFVPPAEPPKPKPQPEPTVELPPPAPEEKPEKLPEKPAVVLQPQPGGFGDLLKLFGRDQETLLLLSLLFLLIREGADTALILALVYILL